MIWWIGAVTASAAAIVLTGAALSLAVRMIGQSFDKIYQEGWRAGRKESQRELHSKAWWFSEDAPTRALIGDLAEMGEWEAREKWRKARGLSLEPPQRTPARRPDRILK